MFPVERMMMGGGMFGMMQQMMQMQDAMMTHMMSGMLEGGPEMGMMREGGLGTRALICDNNGGNDGAEGGGQELMALPNNRNPFMMMGSNVGNLGEGCHTMMYSSQQVFNSSDPSQNYSRRTMMQAGPSGVVEARTAIQDGGEGVERIGLHRQLGDRYTRVMRTRNQGTGEETVEKTVHNVEDDNADLFDQEWRQRAQAQLPSYQARSQALSSATPPIEYSSTSTTTPTPPASRYPQHSTWTSASPTQYVVTEQQPLSSPSPSPPSMRYQRFPTASHPSFGNRTPGVVPSHSPHSSYSHSPYQPSAPTSYFSAEPQQPHHQHHQPQRQHHQIYSNVASNYSMPPHSTASYHTFY